MLMLKTTFIISHFLGVRTQVQLSLVPGSGSLTRLQSRCQLGLQSSQSPLREDALPHSSHGCWQPQVLAAPYGDISYLPPMRASPLGSSQYDCWLPSERTTGKASERAHLILKMTSHHLVYPFCQNQVTRIGNDGVKTRRSSEKLVYHTH